MLEKDIEKMLVRETKNLGGFAYKWVSPGHSGVPDRIVVLPDGKIGFCELKRPGGKMTKLQHMHTSNLERLGCFVRVVDSASGVFDFLRDLQRSDAGG